jgi:hypothetical protein
VTEKEELSSSFSLKDLSRKSRLKHSTKKQEKGIPAQA